MIKNDIYPLLLNSLSVGSSVAEKDEYLEKAKVDTPILGDLLNDRVDMVLGSKGSGKTSIFRLVISNRNRLLEDHLHIITGVEEQGNPVFELFKEEFDGFTEDDFENFWKIYFTYLVYNNFLIDPHFDIDLRNCSGEIGEFSSECMKMGIPQIKSKMDLATLVKNSIDTLRRLPRIKKIKGSLIINASQPGLFVPTVELELGDKTKVEENKVTPIYTSKLGELIEKILYKSDINIWIMLDRLDIVFEHGSRVEFIALRGLLKAYESYQVKDGAHSKKMRIKIFLRDDIFDFLTKPSEFKKISGNRGKTLPALTHISSRSTKSPLRWNKEQIQQLILRRLFLSQQLRDYFGIKYSDLDKGEIRNTVWNQVFGEKIEPGQKKSDSVSWVYSRLSDAHQATPRSAIDFLEAAVDEQKRLFNLDKVDQERLLSASAIKRGIEVASSQKYTQETKNEYPKLIPDIEKLRNRFSNLSFKELQKIYKNETDQVIKELSRVGILDKKNIENEYKVAFIYRPALDIHPKY